MPIVSTRELVDSADLIIVGKVQSVQQIGTGSIILRGKSYTRLDYQAEITVDETIKGDSVPSNFILGYSTPSEDSAGNVAEGGLVFNAYRIIFLVKTSVGYKFANPFYPSLPASPKPCAPSWQVNLGEDAYHKVQQKVLQILCAVTSSEEKQWALWTVSWDHDSDAAPSLKAALALPEIKSSAVLRTSILGDLLAWRDLSVLPLAEAELFQPSKHTEGYLKSNLLLSISRLDPRLSVPLLARALRLPELEARVGAARFLEYTNSQAAVDVLLSALDDPDREVQFAVMQSLGNLTNQHQWRPRTVDFDSHWAACIEHWRETQLKGHAEQP